ncbi:MAG TPA: zinc-dependent alcohol dehydrogenase family protein [Gammaproteobacteria bacterium]|nr:zinc-dependent alcohol dehydrogenase family protein [Gammaproteobacteria bacterium]
MRAMVQRAAGEPLVPAEVPRPRPGSGQLLVEVEACAVCRTDLHVVDDELPDVPRPVVPGHQVVGRVVEVGNETPPGSPSLGDRVGVAWLGYTCGACAYCKSGKENLCDSARFTGYTLPGGFAEYLAADARYCYRVPERAAAERFAPLLCAGLIGYRALRMCGDATRIGLYGFGAAAHIVAQVIRAQGRQFAALTRPGDAAAQAEARALGASWVGGSDRRPPDPLDAAILFAPVGALVPAALAAVAKGGTVVCAGIHMSNIPEFPYSLLWGERVVRSVANLTRADGTEFLALVERTPIATKVETYPLEEANRALEDLRAGAFTGSAVLVVERRPVSGTAQIG